MGGEHVIYMLATKAIRGFAKIRCKEGGRIAIPCLDPRKDVVRFVLELSAKLMDMFVDHLLVYLEPTRLWIEMQHAPSDFAYRQSITNTQRYYLVRVF